MKADYLPTLSFLQLSFVCLSLVPAVQFAALNSVRRPVIVVCAFFLRIFCKRVLSFSVHFGGAITLVNWSGIVLATFGIVFYGKIQEMEMARVEREKSANSQSQIDEDREKDPLLVNEVQV